MATNESKRVVGGGSGRWRAGDGEKWPPTSRIDSLVVGVGDGRWWWRGKAPTSHNNSLVLCVAGIVEREEKKGTNEHNDSLVPIVACVVWAALKENSDALPLFRLCLIVAVTFGLAQCVDA